MFAAFLQKSIISCLPWSGISPQGRLQSPEVSIRNHSCLKLRCSARSVHLPHQYSQCYASWVLLKTKLYYIFLFFIITVPLQERGLRQDKVFFSPRIGFTAISVLPTMQVQYSAWGRCLCLHIPLECRALTPNSRSQTNKDYQWEEINLLFATFSYLITKLEMKSHVWSNFSKYSSTELKSVFCRIHFNIVKCMEKIPPTYSQRCHST